MQRIPRVPCRDAVTVKSGLHRCFNVIAALAKIKHAPGCPAYAVVIHGLAACYAAVCACDLTSFRTDFELSCSAIPPTFFSCKCLYRPCAFYVASHQQLPCRIFIPRRRLAFIVLRAKRLIAAAIGVAAYAARCAAFTVVSHLFVNSLGAKAAHQPLRLSQSQSQ